jgi:hypothetical protein
MQTQSTTAVIARFTKARSGATTSPTVPGPPPYRGQIWGRYVPCCTKPQLPTGVEFGTATCPVLPSPGPLLGLGPEVTHD